MGRRSNPRELELAITTDGKAELRDAEKDETLWSSDDDDDFRDEFGEEFLVTEDVAEDVVDYLASRELIDSEEADELEIYEETDDGQPIEGELLPRDTD
jgi:hypothetical protein